MKFWLYKNLSGPAYKQEIMETLEKFYPKSEAQSLASRRRPTPVISCGTGGLFKIGMAETPAVIFSQLNVYAIICFDIHLPGR